MAAGSIVNCSSWFHSRVWATVLEPSAQSRYACRSKSRPPLKMTQAHTPLFHIPIAHVLSAETSRLRSLLSEAEWASLSGWLPLMLVMMYEQARGEDSPWHAYLSRFMARQHFRLIVASENMPSHFDSPMFWSDQELVELKGTDIFGESHRHSS